MGLGNPKASLCAEDTLSILVLGASAEKMPSDCLWISKSMGRFFDYELVREGAAH